MATTLMPDPSLFCVDLGSGVGELCIEFPGGAKLCASDNVDLGDPGAIVQSLLGQVNTALVPLAPFFNILDALKAMMDCVMAIPDALGPPPDPTKIVACIPGLTKAINKLLAMLPQLSIPPMVKSILRTIIEGLKGVRAKLLAMIRHAERVFAAATAAARLGNVNLQIIADCANDNLTAQFDNLNASMAPLNRLIGLVNVLLELVGLDCIPAVGGLASLSKEALAPLDAVIRLLEQMLALIPSPELVLPALPPAGECP